jgi:hypothetical protein
VSFPIVALWSHPRSMSTAFERTMRARGDLECMHEPFMYDYYINRAKRQMPHFDAMDDHPRSYEAIRDMILAKAEKAPVFFKDMSYYVVPHILADDAFMRRVTHGFLLRDLKASIVSYAKLDPEATREEIGIEAQWRHANALIEDYGQTPVVVLSERVQADPLSQMRRYWEAVGLSDKPEALNWGEEPPSDWQQVQAWHQKVMASSTIRPVSAEEQRATAEAFDRLIEKQPVFGDYYLHHLPFHQRLAASAQA